MDKPAIFQRNRFIHMLDLLRELVARDMKLRYKRSAVGIIWSLLNPLAQLIVLNLVFTWVLPLEIANYTVFLFTGLLGWNWFQSSLLEATGSIVDNRELIRQPGLPVIILPLVSITTNFIHYLLALPVLLIFLTLNHIPFNPYFWTLPLVFTVQFLLIASLSYPLAALHVVFRDVKYLLGVALLLGFYLSPVFYDAAILPERIRLVYRLNPLASLLDNYRSILINGLPPEIPSLLVVFGISVLVLLIGIRSFLLASYHFAEEL
jgi:lipopolysaccharide transport system permease protein